MVVGSPGKSLLVKKFCLQNCRHANLQPHVPGCHGCPTWLGAHRPCHRRCLGWSWMPGGKLVIKITTPRPKKGNQNGDFQGYFRSILFSLKSGFFGLGAVILLSKWWMILEFRSARWWYHFDHILVCISNISLGFWKGTLYQSLQMGKMVPPGSQFTIFLGWKIGFTPTGSCFFIESSSPISFQGRFVSFGGGYMFFFFSKQQGW